MAVLTVLSVFGALLLLWLVAMYVAGPTDPTDKDQDPLEVDLVATVIVAVAVTAAVVARNRLGRWSRRRAATVG